MTVIVTDDDFQAKVLEAPLGVLVYFWAEWSHYCEQMNPIVDELAEEYAGQVIICKIAAIDNNPQISKKFDVRAVPCVVLIKNAKVLSLVKGAVSKDRLRGLLEGL